MSDINEEQKRLYKRAKENDYKLYKDIAQYEENDSKLAKYTILELQNRINKAIEYIWSTKYEYGDLEEDNEDFNIDVYELLNILQGSDKE